MKNASPLARALSILAADGPLRCGELAAAGEVARTDMDKLLRTMAGDELVYRIADVDDARDWLIAITPKGASALGQARRDLVDA